MTIDLNKTGTTGPSADINRLIDQAILDTPRTKRKYLGASSLGGPCIRQIQYGYLDMPIDDGAGFSAKTYRIFGLGHILEDSLVKWLRNAGFDLRNEKKNGEQFGFEVADGRVQGHVDGVFVSGPDVIQYPCLWEAKTMASTKWNAFKKHGVVKSHPQYYSQVALYQAYMELSDNPAVLTSINKNTSEIHHELIPFDADMAQKTSDRAVNIIQAGDQMLPQVSADPTFWICKFCDFQRRCHEL
jgi:hypothetical protein